MKSPESRSGIIAALTAAALFGVSTPLAKLLGGDLSPVLLAGLLYAGSGIGLALCRLVRRALPGPSSEAPLRPRDLPWLLGAVLFGGVLAPVLLMLGLQATPASTTALLLNFEAALTAAIAWIVFRENVSRGVFFGMLLIVVAGVLLSWQSTPTAGVPWAAIAIVGACLCWAIDNNLTRAIAASDALQIASIKGLVAGPVNIAMAFALGAVLPGWQSALAAGAVGFVGYGISLVLFVLALRQLGTARTSAYFSIAPFVGAAISLLLFHEAPNALFWIAGVLMAAGVWLHVRERHTHEHVHEALAHNHPHRHDAHHQHAHDFAWDGSEPHTHAHEHEPLKHRHVHYPDIHHRHAHRH
jgi:drug/metabolite transporter (DMT)-like permease